MNLTEIQPERRHSGRRVLDRRAGDRSPDVGQALDNAKASAPTDYTRSEWLAIAQIDATLAVAAAVEQS